MSESRAVKDPTMDMVAVKGTDAEGFLQGIVSQDVTILETDRARRSFLLGPQGKLRAILWMTRDGDRFQLFTDRGLGERLKSDLTYYKIRVKAEIADPIPAWQLLGTGQGVLAPLGGDNRLLTTTEPAHSEAMSMEEWTALRIEAGEPLMGIDVDTNTIPLETGLVEEAVSSAKGCYLGQELVARLESRGGRVNRHLRGLQLEGPCPVDTPVIFEGEVVGSLSSVAWSDRWGSHLGLALLKRMVEPGASVEAGGVTAEVLELPFPARVLEV
ncbi:MAG TPA: glycine cleavage T C-terminal barrel domain-containing protein [Acidimicrobiia bacterium]|nr:glycine cleavage T C-terminal barrel domain-containing protein [Acidimicrobiia bacterium]